MKYVIALLLFSTNLYSQNNLNFGDLRSDNHLLCNNKYFNIEKKCGLDSICGSKNELEVRLIVFHTPSSEWDLFVLKCNKGIWESKKYTFEASHKSYDPLHPVKQIKLYPTTSFDSIFLKLKHNNIFTLPDQDDLKVKPIVNDGDLYVLTFKANIKFRRYFFSNPNIYRNEYKQIKEFENYYNVSNIFYNELHK